MITFHKRLLVCELAQRELVVVVDVTHYLYYVDVLDFVLCDLEMLTSLIKPWRVFEGTHDCIP
jgi:hypothetical protein